MGVKVKVSGVSGVLASLKSQSLKGRVKMEGVVGYSAGHALYVHEDLETYHENGQAKFLEEPARLLSSEMLAIVKRSVENKNGLEEGIERACNLLLETSLPLVPVDTGELRDSGYVEIRDR